MNATTQAVQRIGVAPYWLLIIVAGLRSLTQGYINVVAPLFLLTLGMNATGLGELLTGSFLFGAVLLVPVGLLADRHRRLPFLILYTVLISLWGFIYAGSLWLPGLIAISLIAGIGRGGGGQGGGQSGPFTPVEQTLLADLVPPAERPMVYTWNASISAVTSALGAGLSGLPNWFPGLRIGPVRGVHVLFLGTAIIGLVSMALLMAIREPPPPPRVEKPTRAVLSPESSRMVVRQSLAGASNAFAQGFASALFVVWLHARFHVGAGVIGPIFAVSFLVQAASFFLATKVARHIGTVRTISAARLIAAVLMAATAFAPTVLSAAVLQVLRTAVASMITPVRQSFNIGLFPSRERASATALSGFGRRISAAISPAIGGALIAAGDLSMPFFLGGFFQLASAVLYWRFFLPLDKQSTTQRADVSAPDFEV